MLAVDNTSTPTFLRDLFGERLQVNAPLANYTSARVGGTADALVLVRSADELARAAETLWQHGLDFVILGSGSNVLVSDRGVRQVVLLNKAGGSKVEAFTQQASVWAESGANLGLLARQMGANGYSGLEWAATIPGSLGGAVYGNAGAHGGDMAGSLILAEILHPIEGRQEWSHEKLAYTYRSSLLKREPRKAVILSARLRLKPANPETVKKTMDEFVAYRKQTQPPGASLGSMFKNPSGDHAGRLIEASGLKGKRVGGVAVSEVHANFFVNDERARAQDYYDLIRTVIDTVEKLQGVRLELEVELIGDWDKPKD